MSRLLMGRPALTALTRVLEKWIAHFLGIGVTIRPQREIDDAHWVWHVGLDAEASALLNDLYNRADVDEDRMKRLLCLFQLDFADPAAMRPALAGRPVYLAMAMDARGFGSATCRTVSRPQRMRSASRHSESIPCKKCLLA